MFGKYTPRSSSSLFSSYSPIIAHRGGAREAPENTLLAFKRAVGIGCPIECDVRLSGDNQVVVFHDATLERTTDGQGRVSNIDLEVLQALDAGQGEKIPKLTEMLELVGNKVPVIIEVKCRYICFHARRLARQLVSDIKTANASSSVVVASFNPFILHSVKQMMPQVLRGLIFSTRSWFALKEFIARPDLLMPDCRLVDKEFVNSMHDKGYRILPWTVDDEGDARRMMEHGVDGVITNRPGSLSLT